MRVVYASVFAVAVVIAAAGPASAQDQNVRQDIDQLRRELDALKQEYGQRLAALEAKITAAEGAAAATPSTPPPVQPGAAPGQPATAQVPAGAAGAGGPEGALPVYG